MGDVSGAMNGNGAPPSGALADTKRRVGGAGIDPAARIPFINTKTGNTLVEKGDALYDSKTGEKVAPIEDGLPRFVPHRGTYAESFGYEWHRWPDTLSDSRRPSNRNDKRNLLLERTRFDRFSLEGKTLLECGMGGGDDTEILLQFPFSQVHSFDLSHGADRAARFLDDPRLVISQASILDIPYPDHSFDVVFCHRVLQHTPDPEHSLRCIAKKVKVGGLLFVHSYHKSLHFMMTYKYKYRPITRRLPVDWVAGFLDKYGHRLHELNRWIQKQNFIVKLLGHNFVPFERMPPSDDRPLNDLLDICRLNTFDALTPRYDNPMTWSTMKRIVESEGFEIKYAEHRSSYPLWCTSVRVR